jgi:hypothetical protein
MILKPAAPSILIEDRAQVTGCGNGRTDLAAFTSRARTDGHYLPDLRRLLRDCNLGQRQNLRQCKGRVGTTWQAQIGEKHGHPL